MTVTSPLAELTADAFAERLFSSALGAFECLSVYVGERLGWYRSLAGDGPATPAELAARTDTQERYAREWLEQQAVIGILETDPADADRRYAISPAAAEVLTNEHSLLYLGALPRLFAMVGAQLPALLDSYRHGGGVSWADFGDEAREAQAELNRPWFESALGDALGGVPEVHSVLSRPAARIADVGCGAGWSTIALARAYPDAHVEGIDIDAPSVEMARRNAAAAGLSDRVSFLVADGASGPGDGTYDAAFAFECIHDMPNPVAVLGAMRRLVGDGGTVLIVDEKVADRFVAPGDDVERYMYGFSILHCLPVGMVDQPSVGTGTVMRASTFRGYAAEAGFASVEELPIEHDFFRFYRLGS